MNARAEALLVAVLRRPTHVVLGALVVGLGLGARWPGTAVASSVAGALALVAAGGRLDAGVAPRAGVWSRVLAGAVVVAAVLGTTVAQARTAARDATALAPAFGHTLLGQAIVLERPRPTRFGGATTLVRVVAPAVGAGETLAVRSGDRIAVAGMDPGRVVRLRGFLDRLTERDEYLRLRGAHGIVRADVMAPTGGRRAGVLGVIDRVRERAERALQAGLPPPQAALMRGMVLGQDDALDAETRDAFRASGLAHLVAASGANVMLLAALALGLSALLGLPLRVRLFLVLALIAAYVPLAGAGPSIQRAGIMGAAGVAATLASRPGSRVYAVLLAAAVTLAIDPRAGEQPGWQMSFAAVVAIALFAARWRTALTDRGCPTGLAEAAALTAAATVGTAPLIALHFEQLSLVSLPVNVLATPAVAPLMWLGFAAAAVAQVALGPAALLSSAAAVPLAFVGWLAHASSRLPGAQIDVRLGVLGVAAATIVAVAGVRGVATVGAPRVRRAALAAAVVVGVVVVALPRAVPAPPRGLTVSMLDVGQGDATLIQHDGASVLVDTGPPGAPIVERLRRAGVQRLDVLVVTHAQADHDGGAADVLSAFEVGVLLDGRDGLLTPNGARVDAALARATPRPRRVVARRGQVIRAGPLTMSVLWPAPAPPGAGTAAGADPNLRPAVLHLRSGPFTALLAADAESGVLAGLELEPVDFLKVPHHGSADPGLPALLTRLRPRVAGIECGRENTYGHPAPSTLAALRAVPSVWRTDRDGTVRLTVDGDRIAVEADG